MNDDASQIDADQPIARQVDLAPRQPGCYLWKGNEGEVLYVGKASNLRNRLKSYLRPDTLKTEFLMNNVVNLDWVVTETESEALILEANLIKKYKPAYNVRLKDDKRYPHICISTSETYPQIFITRKVKDDGNQYFGPYTDVRAARNIIEFIHKMFPIRKVRQSLPLKKPARPCMNFHIKRCLAPCQGNVPVEEYDRIVSEIILFLEGKREILENVIIERMKEYATSMEYEKAAMYRDLLTNVRKVTEQQSVMSPGGGDEDVIAVAREGDHGQIVLMEIRGGRLLDRKSFPLVGLEKSDENEILYSFMRDYYTTALSIPSKIVLPVKIRDTSLLESFLSEKTERKVKIRTVAGQELKAMLNMATMNAELLLKERILATKIRNEKQALLQLQEMLRLDGPPRTIECYDISHLSGKDTVASGVMFVDGKPHKPGYRHYKIRTVDDINDPASMGEVIARRIQRLLNEEKALPDLIVIDGGYTQLTAAGNSAISLGADHIPMVGLAKKREELYFPGDPYPHRFDPDSPGMRLLRQARDEAHRFGVTHQRSLRNKSMLKSALEDIPDIGPARKKALQKHFAERDIKEATVDDLLEVSGIGPDLAQKIHDGLKEKSPS